MTRRRNLYPSLKFTNELISAKSAAQILSIPLTSTLLFSNFLFTGLCNSSAKIETFFYPPIPIQILLLFLSKMKQVLVPFSPLMMDYISLLTP